MQLPWASRDILQLASVGAESVELWPLQNLMRNFWKKKNQNQKIRGLFDKSSKIYSSLNRTLIQKTVLEDSVSPAEWKKSGFPWICVLWSSSLTHPLLYSYPLYSVYHTFLRSFSTSASLFSDTSPPSMSQGSWTSVLQLVILGPLVVHRNPDSCQQKTWKNTQRLLYVQANGHTKFRKQKQLIKIQSWH